MSDRLPETLHDLLDGRLDETAAAEARARIANDPAWAEAWAELQRIQAWVRGHGAEEAPPPALREGLRARLTGLEDAADDDAPIPSPAPASGAASVPPRSRRLMRILTLGYASAALLVVGFTVAYVFLLDGPADPGRVDLTRADVPPSAAPAEQPAEAMRIEKPEDAGSLQEPSGGLGAPASDAPSPDAPSPDAGAPPPPARGAPSPFRGPHDGLTPGLREPRDTPRPAPPAGSLEAKGPAAASREDDDGGVVAKQGAQPSAKAKDARPADTLDADTWGGDPSPLGRAAAQLAEGDVVYVIETSDPVATQRRLTALLAAVSPGAAPAAEADEAPGPAAAPEPARAPTARGKGSTAGPGIGLGGGAGGGMEPVERLYALEADALPALRARLEDEPAGKQRPGVDGGASDDRDAGVLRHFVTVDRPLSDEAVEALAARARVEEHLRSGTASLGQQAERRAGGRVRDRAEAEGRARGADKKAGEAQPEAAPAEEAEAERPAPAKREKKPAGADGTATTGSGAKNDEAPNRKRAGRRAAERPRRLRILILERR